MPGRRIESPKVVVTGAAGYIGSVLVSHLLAEGYRVEAVDSLMYGGDALVAHLRHPRFRLHHCDIRDLSACGSVLAGADAVVHLAAIVGFPACAKMPKRDIWEINYQASLNLVNEAERNHVRRFVFASSYSNYGVADESGIVTEESPLNPQSLYAETKVAAEVSLREQAPSLGVQPVLLRFATVFGVSPRMRFDLMVNQFVFEAHTSRRIELFQPDASRSFLHVFDAARAIEMAVAWEGDDVSGETFNVGSDDANMTKRELAALVARNVPGTVVEVEEMALDGDIRSIRLSCEKIRRRLSFHPTVSVERGVVEIIKALAARYYHAPESEYHRNARLV
ncbi:MAG: NAD(P)-dependent oxidoreductase [Armatimonadota bacterium]|nr:MAG: NAD(P)-dependent oxidoreductase [Armatimonadota bacterium]